MKTETMRVRLTFTEPTLATSPANAALASEFITSKAPEAEKAEEELAALPAEERIEKSTTVFPKDEKGLFCWDYQLRGYFKEQIATMIELGEVHKDLTKWSYKKSVDKFLFIKERRAYYLGKDGKIRQEPDGVLERPIRVTTMQGERVGLSRSQKLLEGTRLEFTVEWLVPTPKTKFDKKTGETKNVKTIAVIDEELLRKCLDYGIRSGLSQWRGGGYGRFTYEVLT
jgi:hypothetical protein